MGRPAIDYHGRVAEVTLRLLGTGDAVGSGGRFHTCFLLQSGGDSWLIDCGASSAQAMARAGVGSESIDGIVLSHLHGDHFGGIPFFLLDCRFIAGRRRALTIAGPPGLETRIRTVIEASFPRFLDVAVDFPIVFQELTERTPTPLGPLTVTPFAVRHPSGAPSYALRLSVGGKVVAFSGDTEWTDALLDAARGADLFLCECYTYEREVPWHLTYRILEQRRDQFECGRLILTHMSDEMLAHVGSVAIETASDGQEVVV
jgi:ribonuclease BN (tRNA processing enzyme)